jgi:hypothetical protein
MDWLKLAEVLNALRVIPRIMLATYTLVWYQVIVWFMTLPDPSMAQSGLVSVVTGAGAAWFGLYIGGKK